MLRIVLIILFVPLIFFYGYTFYELILGISFKDPNQLYFWISLGGSTVLSYFLIASMAFFPIFEHELTHNIIALLTFNKPVGFHVQVNQGGMAQYRGRGNFLITLSPYFVQTFTFLVLPLYLILRPDIYLYFFVAWGVITGYHTSSTIKETHLNQSDLRKNGLLFSFITIILGNIITYGLIIAFTIGRWKAMGQFMKDGALNFYNAILDLYHWVQGMI